MEPLVSILIPAFNAEEFVAETIRSALAQTWRRIEIIVVDDGSTDRTADVCRQFASSSVAVVSQPHRGASAARNTALSLCQGDYVQWLDADDLMASDKVAKQLETLGENRDESLLLSCSWAYFGYRPHRAVFVPTSLWTDLSPAEWLFRKLNENIFMTCVTWLVSRRLTETAGPWDTTLLADNDGEYFCRVLLASTGVRFVPEARVFYRRRAGSLSHVGLSKAKMEAKLLSAEKHIAYLRSLDDSDRSRAACVRMLQRYLAHIDPAQADLVERAQRLATALGGRLPAPQLSWKYAWIQKLFGGSSGKRAQVVYNHCKSTVFLFWDRSVARLEDLIWTTPPL
jgi:glycosyltransferase involved in cell wall biosynthesis